VVTNPYGAATSAVLAVELGVAPAITTQPSNQIAALGAGATFSTTVSGAGPLAYQWVFEGTNLPRIIKTVAGNGSPSYSGDGGPAIAAALNRPKGVMVDGGGNLYIADHYNNRIRKIDTNGIITTVAGTGVAGYSGDGGPATNAQLSGPYSMMPDRFGNLYIPDHDNNRIRFVDTNGVITTIAGTGTNGFSGDGGPATNAAMWGPDCLALDAFGNVYFSDINNNRVRKVDTNGIVTTVAGTGVNGYSGDVGVATNTALNGPSGLVFDASGNLFIADSLNCLVRKVDLNGTISTVAGLPYSPGPPDDGGAATNSNLYDPGSLVFDGFGNLLIADDLNSEIQSVTPDGIISTLTGKEPWGFSGDGGAAINAQLHYPFGVTVDAAENLFIADTENNRIREIPAFGSTLTLENLIPANAGNYALVVTNAYGSVTSAVATITIALPPVLTMKTPVLSGQNLVLPFGIANTLSASFVLLQSPYITGPWTMNTAAVLSTNAVSDGHQFSVPAPASTVFYRVQSP
jgi:hypothetical protein